MTELERVEEHIEALAEIVESADFETLDTICADLEILSSRANERYGALFNPAIHGPQ